MKIILSVILSIIYIVIIIMFNPAPSKVYWVWFDVGISLVYLLIYLKYIKVKPVAPILVIFVTTVLIPILILFAIGNSVYKSWPITAQSLFEVMKNYWLSIGTDMFLPIIVSTLAGYIYILTTRSSAFRQKSLPPDV